MQTLIYFVRHGEVYNPDKIFYGRLPGFGLTKKGREEIKKTAEDLSNKKIHVIYASPLLRAKQSAQIIRKKLGLEKIYFSKHILEVDSSLQGKPEEYLQAINYEVLANSSNHVIGETLEDLEKRIEKFINKIVKKHEGKNIVVVSHGDLIMTAKALSQGLSTKNVSIRPGKDNYIKTGAVYLFKK